MNEEYDVLEEYPKNIEEFDIKLFETILERTEYEDSFVRDTVEKLTKKFGETRDINYLNHFEDISKRLFDDLPMIVFEELIPCLHEFILDKEKWEQVKSILNDLEYKYHDPDSDCMISLKIEEEKINTVEIGRIVFVKKSKRDTAVGTYDAIEILTATIELK